MARGNKRSMKDPNAPKRNLSAYFIWLKENRSQFTGPGVPVTEVTKRAGEEWRNMDGKDKEKWEKLAAKDRTRYETEMKEYRRQQQAG